MPSCTYDSPAKRLRIGIREQASFLKRLAWTLAVCGALTQPAIAQVQFTVGKGQTYTSIQKAVDACPAAGCVISLTDSVYTLSREVWIEAKNNLTIQPSAQMKALKIRPKLVNGMGATEFNLAGTAANPTDPLRPAGWKKWPTKGTSQHVAGAAGDTGVAGNPYSTSGFQNNGYVVIYKSTNVLIDGIQVDGKRPMTFVNKGIWDDKWDVFFGNVGINIFESKRVIVRGTEIKNCFAGFYLQNRNVGGAFAAPNPNDLDKRFIVPYSQYGKMGDHLIERNYIHNNWYMLYDEMEWDIGSTIRYNLCDQNYNTQFAQNTDSSSDANNMTGGFMYMKDVRIVPHKIYNNTINGSSIVFGHGYFKPGVQHYFYNNLVTGWNRAGKNADMIKNDRQLLQYYKDFLYNNTFEVGQDDAFYQIQSQSSGSVNDAAACASASQSAPCYLNWTTPVKLLMGIQNQWLWNGWQVAQGANYLGTYKGAQYSATNGQNIDFFNEGGVIQKVNGLGATAVDISSQANYWARTIPYKNTVYGAAGFLEPDWSAHIVDTTVHDKGWAAAGNLDADQSPADRGAISDQGDGIISPLTLKDQFIVTLDKTNKTVSFQYCIDAIGAASGLDFEMTSYYKTIALSSEAVTKPSPAFPAPVQLTNTGTKPAANSCGIFKASLPTAPVDSFARFDLVVKGTVDGKPTKSNVGVWIWRETQYKLDVYFTKSATGTDTIKSARVGDPVYMHVIGRRTDNNSAIPKIDVLAATPDKNMYLLPSQKQIMPGDTIDKNLPGTGTYNVTFSSTGTVTVALSGMVGNLPVPGAGALNIRPGLPERAIWQSPVDYQYVDHSLPLDSTATVMDQSPTPISLQVVDKYGNNVDTVAKVDVSVLKIDPLITSQGFAATAAGPFTATTFTSDATGKIAAFNTVAGIEGQKFWGFATVDGKTVVDSALMKVGRPRASLYFTPAGKIDTFVTIAQKVHLILSKDGIATESADALSNAFVSLRSALGSKVYASATSTTALDSVALLAGAVDVWVRSNTPITNDTIFASNPWIGNGVAAQFQPVSFRMPPQPPTPIPLSAVFLDNNCDSLADSVVVKFDPNAIKPTLDPLTVRIDRIRFVLPSGDSVVLDSTSVRTIAGGASVGISLPASVKARFKAYTPTAELQLWAAAVRPLVGDTVVVMGKVSVTDGIAPRPIAAVLVENPSPATTPDTLTVQFSEPVTYSGAKWPFRVFTSAMAEQSTTGLTVIYGDPGPSTSLKFVLSGNTSGVLAEKSVLAIAPAAGLADVAGNDSRFASCGNDTASVALKAVIVAVKSAALLDRNGDGMADVLRIVFRRDFRKASERPDSVLISNWDGAQPRFAKLAATDSVQPATYEIALAPNFPLGSTVGANLPSGAGVLDVYRGVISTLNPVEKVDLADSVPPIAVGVALLEYAAGTDKITVTYSEPMKISNITLDAMALKTSGVDVALTFTNPVSDASGKVWSFEVASGKLAVGDEIRLPVARSVLNAANGGVPSSLGNAPYVPVVGGDRAPDSGVVLDRDGDGVADAIRLLYKVAPKGNPWFEFTWLGKTVSVDSSNYASAVAGQTDVTISVAGFPAGTSGTGAGNSISMVAGKYVGPLAFPLKDGVAPVLVSAYVTYGLEEGAPDTMRLKMSEAGATQLSAGFLVLANQRGAVDLIKATSSRPGSAGDEFLLVCAPDCQLPGFGDVVRLAKGSVADAFGAIVGDSSVWVPVLTGPKPIRYKVAIFPKGVVEIAKDAKSPMQLVDAMSLWIQKEGDAAHWTPEGATAQLWGNTMADSAVVNNGLVGVKLDLNSSFDGQFIAYDNIGTYVATKNLKLDIEDLKTRNLVDGANKYSILVSLNGLDVKGKELASGVYMIRVISFTEQTVNGKTQRVMQQNKLFKLGVHNKFK